MNSLIEQKDEREQRIARNRKIASIFLPHFQKRRDTFHAPENPAARRFVHYTSAEAAVKIISQKQLWLRNAACMTDYREIQHGFTIIQRFFLNADKRKLFCDAVNLFALKTADQAISMFDEWWVSGTIPFRTFIASVSEHNSDEDFHGRLSMWRAFGGSTSRVGIVFKVPVDSPGAEALRLTFSPVIYLKESETEQLILEVINRIKMNLEFLKTLEQREVTGWVFTMLLLAVTCVKHEGFHEEKEWRVVHSPKIFGTPLIKSTSEVVNGVPQLVYNLPLNKSVDPVLDDLDFSNLFDRLVIGPSQYPMAMAEAFELALSQAGVQDASKKIFASGIPIRS